MNPPVEPKPVMTIGKMGILFGTAIIFDAVRAFFALFALTGPAAAGIITGGVLNHYLSFLGSLGTAIASFAGVVVAGVTFGGGAALEPFGIIMGMVIGFAGFVLIYLMLFVMGVSIGDKLLSMLVTFLGSEAPLMDALPALTLSVWSNVRAQRAKDREAQEKYQADMVKYQNWIRSRIAAQQAQARAEQETLAYYGAEAAAEGEIAAEEQQAAANDANYDALPDAANDANYEETPTSLPKAA